jgi:hypothetical protein
MEKLGDHVDAPGLKTNGFAPALSLGAAGGASDIFSWTKMSSSALSAAGQGGSALVARGSDYYDQCIPPEHRKYA